MEELKTLVEIMSLQAANTRAEGISGNSLLKFT